MTDKNVPADPNETPAFKMTDITAPLSEAADTAIDAVKENVGLTVLGGAAIGIVVGALLLPLGRRRKQPRKAAKALTTLAATVTELSQTLAAQAADRAQTTAADASDRLSDAGKIVGKTYRQQSEQLTKQTKKLAEEAADQLNDSGKALARTVVKLVEKIRH